MNKKHMGIMIVHSTVFAGFWIKNRTCTVLDTKLPLVYFLVLFKEVYCR